MDYVSLPVPAANRTGYQQHDKRKSGTDPLDELETYVPAGPSEKEVPIFTEGYGEQSAGRHTTLHIFNKFNWKSLNGSVADSPEDRSSFFADLHHIEPRLDSSPIDIALDAACEHKVVTYGQASELRRKITSVIERYSHKFQKQRTLHDLVINQVRYCREHLEELTEAEAVPRKLKQQLQGLRGDTRRLNDELEKSRFHLIRLQEEIEKLEVNKGELYSTLEKIPTEQELRHLVTCWHLEQLVLSQQAEHYRTTIETTNNRIRENDAIFVKIGDHIKEAQSQIQGKEKERAIISTRTPRTQRECAQLESENGKIAEEAQAWNATILRLQQVSQASSTANGELLSEIRTVLQSREAADTELASLMENYKELSRNMRNEIDKEGQVKDEKMVLQQKLSEIEELVRGASYIRLSYLRERDRLTALKRNLDLETRRVTGQNRSDRDFTDKLLKQTAELEYEADQHREQIVDLGKIINTFGSQGTDQRGKNIALHREARQKFKERFSIFMHIRKMAEAHRKLEGRVRRMNIEKRSASVERGKYRQKLRQLEEECHQTEAAFRDAAAEVSEKTRKVENMQSEYYALDRDRQELRKLLGFSQGGVLEHRDRMTYLNDELRRTKEECRNKVRQLENTQHGRSSLWTSLSRVRKAHFEEREKLKDCEERYERGFSKVLLLRKDLDIYLLKCETFTETFELVSELRACEASLLIDITTQYMLKHVEQNQVVKATHEIELRHRALDSYVEWLHKTADTDIKLLYKRLKWHGSLVSKYVTTRKELRKQLLQTVERRLLLTNQVVQCKTETLQKRTYPTINTAELYHREEMLSQMLITMEQRNFQQSVRLSFLNTICKEMQNALDSRKVEVVENTRQQLTVRKKAERLERLEKLALLDVSVARKRLCDELVLADSLQTMKQLAIEKYEPSLTAPDHLQITYCPTAEAS